MRLAQGAAGYPSLLSKGLPADVFLLQRRND